MRRRLAIVGMAAVVTVALGAWSAGAWRGRGRPAAPGPITVVPGDPVHGAHLVHHVLVCGSCHGEDLGGAPLEGGLLVGRLWAPNLTRGRGGVGQDATPEDWVRAIRHGVGRDGHPLLYMRNRRWAHLGDGDLADVVAALSALPAVDREPRADPPALGLPLAVALGDAVDAVPIVEPVPAIPRAPDATYGRYLAEIAGCVDCHGDELQGGAVPWSGRRAPALAPTARPGWTGAAFAKALLHGRGSDGRALSVEMPWVAYAGLDDTEIDALWSYVRTGPEAVVADGEAP